MNLSLTSPFFLPTLTLMVCTATLTHRPRLTLEHPNWISPPDIAALVAKYSHAFVKPTSMPPSRIENHRINLQNDYKVPPWRPLGSLSEHKLTELKKMLEYLLERGLIRISNSPFGANIFVVKKKDIVAYASTTVG